MMFSERYGFVPAKSIQLKSIDDSLRNRLINKIQMLIEYRFSHLPNMNNEIKYIIDKLGFRVGSYDYNHHKFSELLMEKSKDHWSRIYDIIELMLDFEDNYYPHVLVQINQNEFITDINNIFSEEKSGYRIINKKIVSITNQTEIKSIEEASSSEFATVNTHITKALTLYADRKEPDYENSIKESISAVESICCIITDDDGKGATLGKALSKLESHGIKIHAALKSAFSSLYGYTSDADGIRHGGIDFTNAPEEDAKFMLIACSAFTNYLAQKYSKITENDTTSTIEN